jgi:PAS domain S-box-containing protein
MSLTSQQILDGIPLGVIVTTLSGEIVNVNAALRDLLGRENTDLIGKSIVELAADQNQFGSQSVLEDIGAGKKRAPYIDEFVNKSGDPVPVEIHPSAVDDGASKITNALFVVKVLSEEMKQLQGLQRRNMQMMAAADVSRAATQIHDVQELLDRCVDLIRTNFGFYYAAIFLIDEAGEWANLRAATGEAGSKLKEQAHKLGVGSQSMVGWVTANNAARIALDVGEEAIRFDNPLLPKTRSEMALPLRVRGEVIGALDVQSTGLRAFTDEDIQSIQMMADQVAIAIENARLFVRKGSAGGW